MSFNRLNSFPSTKLSAAKAKVESMLVRGNSDQLFYTLEEDQMLHSESLVKQITLTPSSGYSPALFQNSTPIDFRVPSNTCSKIESVVLEMDVKEAVGSTGVTPIVAPLIIDSITTHVNGELTNSQVLTGTALWLQNNYYSDQETEMFCNFNAQNMGATSYASPAALAAGTTASYALGLPTSVINQFNPQEYKGDVIVSCRFKQDPTTVARGVGAGDLYLQALRLKLFTRADPESEEIMREIAREHVRHIPYMDIATQVYTGTLTAGSQSFIPLNFVGFFTQVCVLIRASNSLPGTGPYTLSTISGGASTSNEEVWNGALDIVDLARNSLLGSAELKPYLCRTFLPAVHNYGRMSQVIPVYTIPLGEDIVDNLTSGTTKGGGLKLSNNSQLMIKPGSSFSTGTFSVEIIGYRRRELHLNQGKFTQSME